MHCWIYTILSLLLFTGSAIALSWTHHTGWVAGILAGFAMLVISIGDLVKQSGDSKRWPVPAPIHLMALFAFAISMFVEPKFSVYELVLAPVLLAAGVYLAFWIARF